MDLMALDELAIYQNERHYVENIYIYIYNS